MKANDRQRNRQRNRQRGCFYGLAIGDALGAAVEFMSPGTFFPVTSYREGGPHKLKLGEWTDDTSMAIALANSIAKVGWNLNDQAERYCDWLDNGTYSVNGVCFDIGMTTRQSLRKFQETHDATTSGDESVYASGNGSIMRLASVPIHFLHLFPNSISELADYAEQSGLPTHRSPQCLSACRYFGLILAGLMSGCDRDEVLAFEWEPLQQLIAITPLHPEIEAIAQGSFRKLKPPEIRGIGYVVKSLEAALWAFHDAVDFGRAVLKAVNLGDDADTTGAICGQLAGAYWGESEIPEPLVTYLAQKEMIEEPLSQIM